MSATLKKCACGICFISDTEDKSVTCHICKEERKMPFSNLLATSRNGETLRSR